MEIRSGNEPSLWAGLQHCNIVDDTNDAATSEASNMHERLDPACARPLSSKLNPVTFKHELPSMGPLRGANPRTKGESEYQKEMLLLEKS